MLHDFRVTYKQALNGLGFEMPAIPIISSIPIVGSFFGHKKPKIAYRDIENMVRANAMSYGLQEATYMRQQAEQAEQVSEQQQAQTGIEETRAAHLLTTPITQQFGKQGELLISVAPAVVKKGK